MRRLSLGICALCAAATAAASATAAVSQASGSADTADTVWHVVPDNELQELRGGMDLGPLVAYFAIQRTVQVDGIVVARMQIVISNLSALGNGGMPTISTSGPLAELVQIMNAPAKQGATAGASPAAGASSSAVDAVAPAVASNQTPAASTGPASSAGPASSGGSASSASPSRGGASVVSTGSNVGTVSGTGTQTGSSAQFGNAINTAVAAANGTPLSSSPSSATSSPAQTAAPASPGAAAATPSTPTLASAGSAGGATPAQAAGSSALTVSKTIPLGNTGQVVVLSNLPNATALTTAVQNEVRAATIQTQTTITATLNSMSFLNAGALANAIRVQMPPGL
jgi:hypothetical protein